MSTLKLPPNDNTSAVLPTTDGMPSRRNSPNYSRPASSEKFSILRWLANPVLVRKKNTNEWRMCVDYTDLNKHCPKDPFGLPQIDQVIDSTSGCDLLCFLDCYFEYHQIAIKEEDQEEIAFLAPFGTYCYTTMSFGLKNTSATYQRAIQALFKK
jgi:hypothetical protein